MDYLSAILWITFYCLGLGSVFGSSRGGAVTDAAHRTDPLGKLAGWLARDLGLPREMREWMGEWKSVHSSLNESSSSAFPWEELAGFAGAHL